MPCVSPSYPWPPPQDEDPASLSGGCCDSELVCASCPLLAAAKASVSLQGRAFSASISSLSIPIPQAVGPCLSSELPISLSCLLGSLREAGRGSGLCILVGCWEELESSFLSVLLLPPLLLLQGCGWDQRNLGFLGAVMLISVRHCPSPSLIPMAPAPSSPQPDQKSLSDI